MRMLLNAIKTIALMHRKCGTVLLFQFQGLQVPRPLTVSWNCDGTRLAAGAEKSVSVITFDSSFRSVSIYNMMCK